MADNSVTNVQGHAFANRLQQYYDEAKEVLKGAEAASLVPSAGHDIKDVDKVGHVIVNVRLDWPQV